MKQFNIRAIDGIGRKCQVRDAVFDLDSEGYLLVGRNKRLVATEQEHGEMFNPPWGRFAWCELAPAQDPRVVMGRAFAAKVLTLLSQWPQEARPAELVDELQGRLSGFDFEAWVNPPQPEPAPQPEKLQEAAKPAEPPKTQPPSRRGEK
jgi:hypothetical protein